MRNDYDNDLDFSGESDDFRSQLDEEHAHINADDSNDFEFPEDGVFAEAAGHLREFGRNSSSTSTIREKSTEFVNMNSVDQEFQKNTEQDDVDVEEQDDEITFDDNVELGLNPDGEEEDEDESSNELILADGSGGLNQNGIMKVIRPDGTWNKKLMIIVGGLGLLLVMFLTNFKTDSLKTTAQNNANTIETVPTPMTINAENIVPTTSTDYASTSGSSVNLSSNSNGAVEQPILNSDANLVQQASSLNGGVPNSFGQPQQQQTTETQTVVTQQPNSQTASMNTYNSAFPKATPKGGKFVLKAGQKTEEAGDLQQIQNYNSQNQPPQNQQEDPFASLKSKILYGTRIQVELVDPVRSGVETNVQAKTISSIRSAAGEVLIPAGTNLELTFQPEEINGRVVAREVFRVLLNGQVLELRGNVKGSDGFTGLTGKIIKQGGSSLGKKILGISGRIGSTALGGLGGSGIAGSAAQEAQNEVRNMGDNNRISYSNKIVEVHSGTRFLLVLGKN